MELRRKGSGGCVWRVVLGISFVMLCFFSAFLYVSAANEKVVSAKTDGETIFLYVKGVSGIAGGSVQIGTAACENIAYGSMDELSVPLRTVILVDNSRSIREDSRPDIQEILEAAVDGRMEGEEFRIGIFSESVVWLCDYTTDYVAVKNLLNNLEYVNQPTYFSDCLYGVIEEMSKAENSVYSRIIVVSDGEEDQTIGYTTQEISELLEKSGIPVCTIGTLGNSIALENMFSFSRASKAEHYLLDGSVSKEEIVTSLLEDQQMFYIRITPDVTLLDGSRKSIRAVLQTDQGEVTVKASVDMPFSSQAVPSRETQESSSGNQEFLGGSQEPSSGGQETSSEPSRSSVELRQKTDETADASKAARESSGNVSAIFNAVGVGLAIILVAVFTMIAARRKNTCRKMEEGTAVQRQTKKMQSTKAVSGDGRQAQRDGACACQTVALGGKNTSSGDTVSLWNHAANQSENAYLVLRDNARPSSMFKVPIRDVIRIGRKDADIVIDYDKYISARQCEIIRRGASMYIRDLKSANGTYYEEIQVHDQEIPIFSGGTIRIGQSKFTITIVIG